MLSAASNINEICVVHLVTCSSKANPFEKVSSSLIENGHLQLMHSSEHFDFTMTCISLPKTRTITTLHLMEIIRIKAVLTKLSDNVVRRIIEKSMRKIMSLH